MTITRPKVYVVILNYKTWQDTLECLESVYTCHYPNFEVVVVDNGSNDESIEKILAWAKGELGFQTPRLSPILKSIKKPDFKISCALIDEQGNFLMESPGNAHVPPLTLIKSEKDRGCYGGFNLGIRWCQKRGDFKYVWILPNDTAVKNDCLTQQVLQAEENDWGICGSKELYYYEPGTIQALAGSFRHFLGHNLEITDEGRLKEIDYVSGNAMLVSRKCLDLGPLPEEYFLYFEDIDFCFGARAAGIRLGVALDAVVYHKDGKSSTSLEKEYYYARNLLHFVRKNMPLALPFSFWYLLVHRTTLKLFKGQFHNIAWLLRGVRDFLRGRLGERA
jgi:GT2 family glycosyltransferase